LRTGSANLEDNDMDDLNSMTGRLPDFIFARRRDIELEANLLLAGILVTDIPEGSEVSRCDRQLIQRIMLSSGT
jgi:hypothetical protein